jgi:hypothetical protein
MKLVWIVVSLFLCAFLLYVQLFPHEKTNHDLKPATNETPLYQFFVRHFLDPSGGVYTNLKNNHSEETTDVVNNHVFLTESTGILLNYAVNQQNKALYQQQVHFLNQNLRTKWGVLRWFYDPQGERTAESNASIDDLRVIRGLLLGYKQWKNDSDLNLALELADGLKKWNTNGNYVVDFYNWRNNERAHQISSSYLDLYTMKLLASDRPSWKVLYEQSLNLVHRASLGNGLYRKTFDIDKNRWIAQSNVNLIDSFYTSLHLSEIGENPEDTISFIKTQWRQNHKLYGVYSLDGIPVEKFESPAVYGLAIQILANTKEKALIASLSNRLKELQIQDHSSPYYGGFVNLQQVDAYSFDQLQVLLSQK